MVNKSYILTLITFLSIFCGVNISQVFAQLGGKNVYEVLNFTVPARIAALGGHAIGVRDNDLNLVSENPSALSAEMNKSIAFNFVNYFGGINYGYIGYAQSLEKKGNWAASILYSNYGKFNRTDETGVVQGTFTAADYVLNGTYSRDFDSVFTMGATAKILYSQYDIYSSFGLALDYAASYHSKNKSTVVTALIKNFGGNIKAYTKGNGGPLPFEIQLGVSHRLKYVPLRFSMVVTNLNRPNLAPDDPNAKPKTDPLTGEVEVAKPKIGDKIMRHFIFGVEIIPAKFLFFRFGYNYQRRQEMKVPTRVALVGFSYGLGVRISKFELSYARASYSLAGGTNHITISTNINSFKSKKKAQIPPDEKKNNDSH